MERDGVVARSRQIAGEQEGGFELTGTEFSKVVTSLSSSLEGFARNGLEGSVGSALIRASEVAREEERGRI